MLSGRGRGVMVVCIHFQHPVYVQVEEHVRIRRELVKHNIIHLLDAYYRQ